ncbi:succinate dehydrogenase, cytochrome b556 subunit [Nitratireductor indicus]|uniref:succinate dehydrogenase, cytochrome b556 subunit n=1 Tax=Nitratireductor indicus TaxID=721133 RepID=UPI0028762AA7|nr:succinate dehydrogenase, cytochrome b556 subunit [Nitratireductor indicus]MDS1138163.1 succinate dehydrogenase, cytochrome b556 subunit [Nitratireductor indicus]
MRGHRNHPLWFAFLLHRLSGLGLALFLPAHFWMLSMVLTDPEGFDGFARWTDHPLVKFAEFGLVFLLAVHLFGGLRLLALEFLPWPARHKTLAAASIAGAFLVSGAFFLNAV